ncbi:MULTISPECIES: DNA-binding protein [Mycobacterium simiae complex]|uniref:DNA-binding protein n=1 Tax=Mycobacterium simiae complex TaxID=2249310 RepID=UPI0010424238|nr:MULTISPECIES: DNA-binding protein [Mycobacterium simiae complex]
MTTTPIEPSVLVPFCAPNGARVGEIAGESGKILAMSWERLGKAVRHRRKELGLNQADVSARGGPSEKTLRAIENNRAGALGGKTRRSLERAIEWDSGSIEAILEGGAPLVKGMTAATVDGATPVATGSSSAFNATERFAIAEHLIKMRRTFATHRDDMGESARAAIEAEFASAARELEDAMVWMLPWLGDDERAAAIRILGELRSG